MKNMNSDQISAIAIQVPSTLSSGCFHQTISLGGSIALTRLPDPFQPCVGALYLCGVLAGEGNGDDLHDPPDNVEDGRHDDAHE